MEVVRCKYTAVKFGIEHSPRRRVQGRTQAARGRRTLLTSSRHREASGADLSAYRQHRATARKRRTGFLNPVSQVRILLGAPNDLVKTYFLIASSTVLMVP